ncbi:multidrug export protein EmrA [Trinickia dabaoshanensis]|uniref:Multidrug export protein EmrA n=1 Tax=Trinickia dabaoshanensis TaxID=564714 RepID=A0A2N7VDS6_9BURK|nr:HlyD family secretion protein [Trinickia dabaoshanensis]PMS15311.1 multidrug export protein EmrA [Trinickia dabaoshanensis]
MPDADAPSDRNDDAHRTRDDEHAQDRDESKENRNDDDSRDNSERNSDKDDVNGNSRKKRSKKPLFILAGVVVVLAIAAFVWWFSTRNQTSTDDAYTDGNSVMIAPKVGGYVVGLPIDDNMYVHKGDVLVEIDPREYRAQLDRARAQLGLAEAQVKAAQVQLDIARVHYPAQYRQAQAQTSAARAELRQAQAAYNRQHSVDARATSAQNIDAADAKAASARANVTEAQAQLASASLVTQQIRQAVAALDARQQEVKQAQAQLEQAQLNLSWCVVRAPADGWVTQRKVHMGAFLQPGESLFSLVTPQVWVTANFKETDLARMHPGDKVEIGVDAYPDLTLRGHVDSVQKGSGSRFSAFPAENATGNFVKIVQRVPVKIVIDRGLPKGRALPLGISVEPTVYFQ